MIDVAKKIEIASGARWELGVAEEFKKLAGEKPDLVPTIMNLLELVGREGVVRADGIELSRLVYYKQGGNSSAYKLEIDGQVFLLKQTFSPIGQSGFKEFDSSVKAEALLKLSKLDKVRVVDYQLGFQGEDHTGKRYTYFVSRFEDLERIDTYTSWRSDYPDKELLLRRIAEIKNVLKHFDEVIEANMLFDPDSGEIVIYDLHEKEGRR